MSVTHPASIISSSENVKGCGVVAKEAIVAQLVEQLIRNQQVTFPSRPSFKRHNCYIFLPKKKNQPPTRKWWMPDIEWVTEICPICGRPYERKKGSPQKICKDINCQFIYKQTHK